MSEETKAWARQVLSGGSGRTYTRDDLVRAILGQQWAVAIALMDPGDTDLDATSSVRRIASLPSPDDVVTAMEQM